MALEAGQTAGGYEFIEILDNSNSGVIYRVLNIKLKRSEMLRILPRGATEDRERVDLLRLEAQVHARLSHSNIIGFYDVTEIDGQLVMTTEVVEGIPLVARLKVGPIPWERAIDYGCQILSALSYTHRQGVLHGNVTPANILITPDNRAMLGGFGMARAATDPNLTRTSTATGGAEYMSPEQARGVTTLDPSADVYSLGVVLYEAVTGTAPFKAATQLEVTLAHLNTVPKPPRWINPDVPDDLDRIILRALAKEPAARFRTASEFSEALSAVVAERAEKPVARAAAAAAGAMPSTAWMDAPRPRGQVVEGVRGAPPAFVPTMPVFDQPVQDTQPNKEEAKSKSKEFTLTQMVLGGLAVTVILTLIFSSILAITGVLPIPGSH